MNDQSDYDINPARVPEKLQPLAEEICTYFRELPRLLQEGQEGKFALIHGNELLSLWDTFGEALEAGYERFGMEKFMAQPIKAIDVKGLAGYFLVESRASA